MFSKFLNIILLARKSDTRIKSQCATTSLSPERQLGRVAASRGAAPYILARRTSGSLAVLIGLVFLAAVPTVQAQEIDVLGNGISITDADDSPSSLDGTDFDSLEVDDGGVTRTFVIKNTGSLDLVLPHVPPVLVQGTHATDFSVALQPSTPVAPGNQVTFSVTFNPTGAGIRLAEVVISNNDPDEDPYNFTIQGFGVTYPEMEISGAGITIENGDNSPNPSDNTYLGDVDVTTGVGVKTYQITNYGEADLVLDGSPLVQISGADAARFTVTQMPASTILPGQSTSFEITFDPTVIGLATAAVSITSNDSDNDPYQFGIQGNGIGPGAPLACVPNFFHIYGDNGTITYLDATTSPYTYTQISEAGYHINGVGYNLEDGMLYGFEQDNVISGDRIVRIDATGSVSVVSVSAPFLSWRADFDNAGNFYFVNEDGDRVGIWDVDAGTVNNVALSGIDWIPIDMAYLEEDGNFYGVDANYLYKLDPSTYTVSRSTLTGALIDDYNSGVNSRYYGAAWSANDGNIYLANSQSGRFYKIDPELNTAVYIGQGEANLNKSDGASCPLAEAPLPNSGTVGDRVWLDTDQDGIQDSGENGFSGLTVSLYEVGNPTPVGTDITDEDGEYLFRNLAPSTYYLEFTGLPSGFDFTSQDAGTNNSLDSDVNSSGITANFTVVVGVIDNSWDAGVSTTGFGDRVWLDSDQDGRQDAGETQGVQGVTVQLYNAGSPIATTVTDAAGKYHFGGVSPGTYQLRFSNLPGGYVFSQPNNTNWYWDDTEDSDANQSTGYTGNYSISSGEYNSSIDAGIYPQSFPEISLSGNGQGIQSGDDTPSSADHTDFGTAATNGGSVVRTFTISNTGAADLSLVGSPTVAISGTHAAEFTVTSSPSTSISNSGSTTFQVTFVPASSGIREATISIANNDSDENPFTFDIQGEGLSPEIRISGNGQTIVSGDASPSVSDDTDFGSLDVVVGGSSQRTFTIENTGDATLNLTGTSPYVTLSGAAAADFSITANPASSINVSGNTTFTLSFSPSVDGTRSATVSIANDDADENPYTFAIQGEGVRTPDIGVENDGTPIVNGDMTPSLTDETDFGTHSISTGLQSYIYTITNNGTGSLTFTDNPAVQMTGANAGDFIVSQQPTGPLAVGATTTFQITFDPTLVGTRTATVNIFSDDPDESPYTFAVKGFGTAQIEIDIQGNLLTIPNGDYTPYPDDLTDFGNVDTLTGVKEHTFFIENTGIDSLHLTGSPFVQLSGANANQFSVIQPNDYRVPANGNGLTFKIRFNPSSLGLKQALVTIPNDDNDENPYTFHIQGTGAVSPVLTLQSGGVFISNGDLTPSVTDNTDLGSVNVTGGSQSATFMIANTGTAPLNLDGSPTVQITGAHAGDFSISQQPSQTTLGTGGASTTFQLLFNPSARGVRQATIEIPSDDPTADPFTFAIKGTGLAPEIDVQGNSITIPNGDSSPQLADGTDFGTITQGNTVDRTFTVRNIGNLSLNLGGSPRVSISGTHAADFSVTQQPAASIGTSSNSTFIVRFDPNGDGERTATLSIANDDPDENPYTFAIKGNVPTGPAMSVTKTASVDTVLVNANFTYTITIENVGGTTGNATKIIDTLPSGFSYVSGSSLGASTSNPSINGQTLTWNGTWTFTAGQTRTLTFTVTSPGTATGSPVTNTASVEGSDFSTATSGATAPVVVIAPPSGAFFAIEKSVSSSTASPLTNVDYTITVTNIGDYWGQSQVVRDTLPDGFSYVASTSSFSSNWNPGEPTIDGQVLTWTENEYLNYGSNEESLWVTFSATVPAFAGTYFNKATVTGVEYQGPDLFATTGPTAAVQVQAPEITLTKTVDIYSALPGDTLTYTVIYMNVGDDLAKDLLISEDIPERTTYVEDSAAGTGTTITFSHDDGTNYDTNQTAPVTHLRFLLTGDLAAGASGQVTFKVRVD